MWRKRHFSAEFVACAWSGYYAALAVSGMPHPGASRRARSAPLTATGGRSAAPFAEAFAGLAAIRGRRPPPYAQRLTSTYAARFADAVDAKAQRDGPAAPGGSSGNRVEGEKKPAGWRAWCSAALAQLIWPALSRPATRWTWCPVRRSAGPAARPRWCCAPAGRRPAPCTDRWRWSGGPGGSAPGSGRR